MKNSETAGGDRWCCAAGTNGVEGGGVPVGHDVAIGGDANTGRKIYSADQAIKMKPLKKAFIAAFSFRRTAARLYALTGFCVKLVPSHSFQSRRLMGHPSRLSSVFIPFGVLTPAAHGLMHVEAYDANPSHAGEDAGLSTRSEPEWHLPCTRTVTTGARVFSMLEAETRDRFRRDLAWSI